MITRCAPQWTGRTDRLLQMNRLKFETSGKSPISLKEPVEIYTSNQYRKKRKDHNMLSVGLGKARILTDSAQKSPRTLEHYTQRRDVDKSFLTID